MTILNSMGNPEIVFENMYKTNPNFKKFIDENKNNTPEQIAKKYGIPL